MCANQVSKVDAGGVILAVSLELAAGKWKVALHDGLREKPAVHTVEQPQSRARLQAMQDLIERHKEKKVAASGRACCCELRSRQEGVWIYRALRARGVACYVIDPASILVERYKRCAKTDRLDAINLVTDLRLE
ncbi:hypothetical protein SAMN05414139_10344 [Burkholderia sp. D7]|nr:hypothetical protein SAMN05414139_10344 [Burkholderia sp. D7]